MKAIYKFYLEIQEYGEPELHGIFITDTDYVDFIDNNDVRIEVGDIANKTQRLKVKEHFKLISVYEPLIETFEDLGMETGWNPFDCEFELNGEFDYDLTLGEYLEKTLKV